MGISKSIIDATAILIGIFVVWTIVVVRTYIVQMQKRNISGINSVDKEESSLYQQILQSIKDEAGEDNSLASRVSRMMGINFEELKRNIETAGIQNTTAEQVVLIKMVGLVSAIGLFLILVSANIIIALCAFCLGMIFFLLPTSTINRKILARKMEIVKSLDDFEDLLASVLEAGLTPQMAIAEVAEKYHGVLAEEFRKVTMETQLNGGRWRKAMEDMADRNGVDELSELVSDILLSVEHGTPTAEVIKKHAQQMRHMKKARVEAAIRSRSILMLLPLALFTFLPLLVILLAPMLPKLTGL